MILESDHPSYLEILADAVDLHNENLAKGVIGTTLSDRAAVSNEGI
jgi:hypothetical protein